MNIATLKFKFVSFNIYLNIEEILLGKEIE